MIYHSNAVVVTVDLSMQCNASDMRRAPVIIDFYCEKDIKCTLDIWSQRKLYVS